MNLHSPAEQVDSAQRALALLKEGNARFVEGALSEKNTYGDDREVLKDGQKPFAVILTCSDSRVAPEIYFDQKLGDLFVVRNAGNVADETVLGSIEYAVDHLGSTLVVVVGHSCCGAVTAALSGGHVTENIQSIVDRIKPACVPGCDLDGAVRGHVKQTVDAVQRNEIIKEAGAAVLGAHYDIHTGVVSWL